MRIDRYSQSKLTSMMPQFMYLFQRNKIQRNILVNQYTTPGVYSCHHSWRVCDLIRLFSNFEAKLKLGIIAMN